MWPLLITAPVCSSTANACFVRCLFTWLALPVKACFEFPASMCLELSCALVVAKLVRCFPTICFICAFTCNISCVYMDTNDWNESLVKMKMLHLSVSVGRFWADTALLERKFIQEGVYADLYSNRHSSTQSFRSCLPAWEYCACQKSTATKVALGENYVFWNKRKKVHK